MAHVGHTASQTRAYNSILASYDASVPRVGAGAGATVAVTHATPAGPAGRQPGPLARALEAKHGAGGSSSEAAMAAYGAAVAGIPASQRAAAITKKRADEARVHQLRGIFSAYDEDKDGYLNESELSSALLALGMEPTPRMLAIFFPARGRPYAGRQGLTVDDTRIDLPRFVSTMLTKVDAPDTSAELIESLFKEFDPDGVGRVPLSVLLHLLCEVDAPSSLSIDEVNELLKMTGILGELQARDPKAIYATLVDYTALVKHMTFA